MQVQIYYRPTPSGTVVNDQTRPKCSFQCYYIYLYTSTPDDVTSLGLITGISAVAAGGYRYVLDESAKRKELNV